MFKTYRYRIYPDVYQKIKIDHTINVCRLVYNLALEVKVASWQSTRISVTAFDLQKQLPSLKKEYPWIAKVDSQSLLATILNLEKSFSGFYRGGGFPRFKNKKDTQSFQAPCNKREVNFQLKTLTIPKIENISIALSRKFSGVIKTVTISKIKSGKYYASILVETTELTPIKPCIKKDTTVGIDIGIKSFAVCSNGLFFEPNRYLKNSLKRLQCLQRRASRKKKGGNNRKKANKCVAILHERIANQRADYIHKITTGLIRDKQTETFVIEDLNVTGMLKNKKLSRAISDVSFGEFRRQMQYKCDWYGKNLIVIDRFAPSSKRCSDCGTINEALMLADREWTCVCGSNHDRDLNAAKNIKYYGLEKFSPVGSRNEPVELRRLRRAKKQE